MFNITNAIFLLLCNIIKYCNKEKLGFNHYLSIFVFQSLLSIVDIDY